MPVLLLQPLVENAIKHGLAPLKNGGCILLRIQKDNVHLIISVIDNGVGPANAKPSNLDQRGILSVSTEVHC